MQHKVLHDLRDIPSAQAVQVEKHQPLLGGMFGTSVRAAALAEQGSFEEAEPWSARFLELFVTSGNHQEGAPFILARRGILARIRNRDTGPYLDKR